MSPNVKRRILAVAGLLFLPASSGEARANHFYARETYFVPTTYYGSALETSWYVPTVSVLPSYYATSYVPSSYLTTSYVASPTSYDFVPTTYGYRQTSLVIGRRPWFGRRRAYYSTAYYPTTWIAPSTVATVYAAPTSYFETTAYEPSSAACCATQPPCETSDSTATQYARPSETVVTTPAPIEEVQRSTAKALPKSVQSRPRETTSATPSGSAPKKQTPAAGVSAVKPEDPKPAEVDADLASPPESPAPEADPNKPTTLGPAVPIAPAGEIPLSIDPKDDQVYQRDARKPILTSSRPTPYLRSARNGTLHVLEGKVLSSLTNELESGVTVTLSNRRQTFADRVLTTDSTGHYKVRLPDGDWTVSVTGKSGKVYPVSELVVSEGQITDDAGDPIPSLTITR